MSIRLGRPAKITDEALTAMPFYKPSTFVHHVEAEDFSQREMDEMLHIEDCFFPSRNMNANFKPGQVSNLRKIITAAAR